MMNRVILRTLTKNNPCELSNDREPNIDYFKVCGCKCFILKNKYQLHKFHYKPDECIFIGYSTTSKTYRAYNKRTLVFEEFVHVTFDESNCYLPMEAHAEEEANIESWGSYFLLRKLLKKRIKQK